MTNPGGGSKDNRQESGLLSKATPAQRRRWWKAKIPTYRRPQQKHAFCRACLPASSFVQPLPFLVVLGGVPTQRWHQPTSQPAPCRHVSLLLFCCSLARSLWRVRCGRTARSSLPSPCQSQNMLRLFVLINETQDTIVYEKTRRKRKGPKRRAMPFVCLDICCCCCTPGKRKRSCLSKAWRGIYKGLRECACGRSLRTKWVLWCDQGRVFVQGQVDEANRQLFHALGAAQKSEQWKRRLCRACGRRLRNPSRWNG